MLLLSVTQAQPLTLADAFKSPSTIVFVLLAIGLVALFLKVQSLSMQIDALKKRREQGAAGNESLPRLVPAPADAELVAILTAAAVACLGRRIVVRRITFLNQNTVSGWAEAGRLSIHTSHNVRRN